jgi:sialate O-acetylesterase
MNSRVPWRPALAAIALMIGGTPCGAAAAPMPHPLLNEMFQDHAVLQRDRPIPVWGEARAGEQVAVSINTTTVRARADAAGHWRAALPAMPAGGPYSLSVRAQSGDSRSVADLLVGDVWLCSGQSNMEYPVSSSLNASREIKGSGNDLIRVLTVARASNPTPLDHLTSPVAWRAAEPDAIKDFSAVCYYFARELQKSVSVPLGLIHSSWGGSGIEAWIGDAGLRAVGGFDERLDLLRLYARDPDAGNQRLAEGWERWWRAHAAPGSTPWASAEDDPKDWRALPEPMRDWKTWGVPELVNHDGMVWFRRAVTLSPEQASGAAALSLGAIDEVDETWVNGRAVGNSFGWGTERTYALPPGVLHAGENSVVVNVLSMWDAGGMFGPADHMALRCGDGSLVPLGGQWRYQFVPDSMGYPPRAPWQSIGGVTGMHNAMIAPIAPYGIRGVLWYQGESNTGDANRYQALLAGLMAEWRGEFGAHTPFLIVELPNFGAAPSAPVASDWASLREAQRRAVAADPHAALAVTIDIGEVHDVHPPNKQEVGRRLARAARHLIYGESISASGPVPLGARREDSRIVVTFDGIDGMLVAHSGTRPIGFELCGSDQTSCRFADATLESNRVLLDPAGESAASRVRFCWGDTPVCNLSDRSGLPAGPFEIPIRQ